MPTIFWAGDSTCKSNSILTYPQTGIGQVFHRFVRPDVRIENHSENGRSTKSFLAEGRFEPIRARMGAGDLLFVQFGHNDEKQADPLRYTDPEGAFRDNLRFFAQEARKKGALPVFITPLTRRNYRDPGAKFDHGPHAQAMRETAAERTVPLIDLCAMSEELVAGMDDAESKTLYMHLPPRVYPHFPDGLVDNTHLRPKGALVFGGLIAKGLLALGAPYADLLVEGLAEALTAPSPFAGRLQDDGEVIEIPVKDV